jgi:hypothetical protein
MAAGLAPKGGFGALPRCFPATTLVQTSLTGWRPIADLRAGDVVLAFDPAADLGRGALVPRRVTRLYRNTTTEWIRLSWMENGEPRELVATPGHHFLDSAGTFPTIAELTRDGRARVVLASGEVAEVLAERIVWSQETAHLYEAAHALAATDGATALKPEAAQAWQTYNVEVEELHTCVAGGPSVRRPRPSAHGCGSARRAMRRRALAPAPRRMRARPVAGAGNCTIPSARRNVRLTRGSKVHTI